MSRQMKVKMKSKMTDLEAARRGLLDMGFKEDEVVLDVDNPVQIRGYKGDTREGHLMPLLITRRGLNRYCRAEYQCGGASNDAGFYVGENGELEMSVSAYDTDVGVLTSPDWQKKLKRRHDMNRAMVLAKNLGFDKLIGERQEGEKMVLKLGKSNGGW